MAYPLIEGEDFCWVPKKLLQEKGVHYAAVFGHIQSQCNKMGGFCEPKHGEIARDLGISRATVLKFIHLLIKDGYLLDLTPDLKNREHCYKDTGKISRP